MKTTKIFCVLAIRKKCARKEINVKHPNVAFRSRKSCQKPFYLISDVIFRDVTTRAHLNATVRKYGIHIFVLFFITMWKLRYLVYLESRMWYIYWSSSYFASLVFFSLETNTAFVHIVHIYSRRGFFIYIKIKNLFRYKWWLIIILYYYTF